jgi:hypothetical protein
VAALHVLVALLGLVASFGIPAQPAPIGRILGSIDGISYDGDQAFLSGWACQQGRKDSIQIHIYARAPDVHTDRNVFLTANRANFDSEPAVNRRCGDREGGKHRFLAALPFGYGRQNTLFVHGIRVVEGVANEALAGSGLPLRVLNQPAITFPSAAVAPLSGAYRPATGHPRVFATAAELRELVARINRPASYSGRRFRQLGQQVARDLAAGNDWDAVYAGCSIQPYLYAFSYEPQDGQEAKIHSVLHLAPAVKAPAGGAVVAARLALYATLVNLGATAPAGAPSPAKAAALAKRILLAWADRGFPRDERGIRRSVAALSCDDDGHVRSYQGGFIPLHLGRGVVYSVHAQDLLQAIGALDAREAQRLDTLHRALFDLIREGHNQSVGSPQPACQRYTNGGANGLAALLAIARLQDDERRFLAVLYGNDRDIPVVIPWTRLFEGAIYGQANHPIECYANGGPDGLHSGPGFTTSVVAPGEVQDRYRAGVLQTFGYPMFTLERLINAAEILRIAGFDAYGYRGTDGQSIELALDYYACYGRTPGFYKTVTRDNASACLNYEQYYGKIVNGVDPNVVIGAYRFPKDQALASLSAAAAARASSGGFALDAILFGRWQN